MKKYNSIFYLLFILLVMGAFASMAQNSYGLKIMGGVALVFGLVFISEFISGLRKKAKMDVYALIEPACLFILSFIFGLGVFYIHFPFIEWLFAAAGVLLVLVYIRKMILRFRDFQPKNNFLAMLVLVFHLSIILFFISLVMVPFAAKTAEYSGIVAFVLLLIFIVAGLLKKKLLVEGESISAFGMIRKFKDYSIIIVSLTLMFSFYIGFNKIGVLPGIYSDEFPRAYFELVNKANAEKEKAEDGKLKHEEFIEKYKQFLKNNKIGDK